jgi:hypothetical protein
MNPAAARAAVLIVELMVFFAVTAFTSQFISHASAIRPEPGEAPPPHFPVIAYEGDRARPLPSGYRVVPWSEWELLAQRKPGVSLLLPERAATVQIGEAGEASFVAGAIAAEKQSVELKWRTGGGEQEARYVAQARTIEPQLLRTLGSQTLLMGAAAGFVAGLFTGRVLRRRWLAVPGSWVPPSTGSGA